MKKKMKSKVKQSVGCESCKWYIPLACGGMLVIDLKTGVRKRIR